MIRSIKIHGYRGFRDLALENLGQINLLVGKNNSGKSSVLEALQLLAAGVDPTALLGVIQKRGEQRALDAVPGRAVSPEFDVCHLFNGHEIAPGLSFTVSTANDVPGRAIEYKIVEAKPDENIPLFSTLAGDEGVGSRLGFTITARVLGVKSEISTPVIPLTLGGTLKIETFQLLNNMVRSVEPINVQYISTESFALPQLLQIWNKITLTPEEERATEALRALDRNIERISPVANLQMYYGGIQRSGFKVKMSNFKEPVPIGSLGDGVWRMLSLAFAMSRAKDGLVLVDEIDTGFHYTVMDSVWNLVSQAASDLNVQVFATTHSNDCINSLASLCDVDPKAMSRITIQRLEPEKNRAVRYTESQIAAAAKQRIEIR